jgi:F0F1-type ATP synthase delta subunit
MSKITTNELATYAVNQLEAGIDSKIVSRKVASFLLEEKRSKEMPSVMRAIDAELTKRGSSEVIITSAHATTDETKKQLASLLDIKNPVFSEVIDRSVIGGVKPALEKKR